MTTRKQFLRAGAAMAASPLALLACASTDAPESYEAAAKRVWRPMPNSFTGDLALRHELVRYATLAPSSHNTQCWKFHVEPDAITILPDLTRRTPVVDPDDHHLHVSLGCALENLAQASLAHGLKSQAQIDAATGAVVVKLEPTKVLASPLYEAIPKRQSSRGPYDSAPLTVAELKALELAGIGNGVSVLLSTASAAIENILELIINGNVAQISDAAFVKELKQWIRFSSSDAVESGDGLFTLTSGNPAGPRWLGSPLFDLMFSAKSENDKLAKQVRSSAGLAVFVSQVNDKNHWTEVGRCYERFALQATALGIRNAMLNQAVEVPLQRQKLASFLGLKGGRPDLVVRFGRGPLLPASLRRDVRSVLI